MDQICPGKYKVATETSSELMKKISKSPRGNETGMCAEPKAASVAHDNPSPITGHDTQNRHTTEHGHDYTGRNKHSDYQMDPCDTCKRNRKEYMEYANANKVEHTKGG